MSEHAESVKRYSFDDINTGNFVKFKDANVKYWALVLEKRKRKAVCEIFHVKPCDSEHCYKGMTTKISYSDIKGVDDAWSIDLEGLEAFHKPTQLHFPLGIGDQGFVALEPVHKKYSKVNWSLVGKNPKDAKRKLKSSHMYLSEHLLQPLARYYAIKEDAK